MLTKEQCKEALDGLRNLERYENLKKWNQVAPQVKADVLEQLIHEHFSEKEPKPPTEETRTHTTTDYKCPNCTLPVHEYARHCSWCGQTIDWTKQLEEDREKHKSVLWG